MKIKSIISAAILVSGFFTARAQDLTKDITIERNLNPTLRAATRLNTSPGLFQPKIEFQPLRFNENAIQAPLTATIDTLPAANPASLIPVTPYRGYALIGYFPTYNLTASAGYNIINRPSTTLGIWGQFDGESYKADPWNNPDNELRFNRNAVAVGIDLAAIIARAGRLDINADFAWARQRVPDNFDYDNPLYLKVTEFNATANWSARLPQMAYYVKADYSHFSNHVDVATTPTQHIFGINGGTAYFFDDHSQLAGSIGAQFQSTSNYLLPGKTIGGTPVFIDSRTIGIIDFKPSYRFTNDRFKLNLGVKLQFTSHMSKSINFAPDVHIYYIPTSAVALHASLTGGKQFNPISELYDYCPYFDYRMGFAASNIPLDARVGATFGPFKGFSLSIEGAYAKANEWLMPTTYYQPGSVDPFGRPDSWRWFLSAQDLSGFQVTVKADYTLNRYLSASASYTRAGNGETNTFYLNRDRAANIINVSVKSNPLDRLTLDLGFTLRSDRSQIDLVYDPLNVFQYNQTAFDLKTLNSLDFGANYRVSNPFSVFARVENILNCRADQLLDLPVQGIHGAVGLSLKF